MSGDDGEEAKKLAQSVGSKLVKAKVLSVKAMLTGEANDGKETEADVMTHILRLVAVA